MTAVDMWRACPLSQVMCATVWLDPLCVRITLTPHTGPPVCVCPQHVCRVLSPSLSPLFPTFYVAPPKATCLIAERIESPVGLRLEAGGLFATLAG